MSTLFEKFFCFFEKTLIFGVLGLKMGPKVGESGCFGGKGEQSGAEKNGKTF